jgi:type I restriction enzyme S subunit
MKEKWDLKEMSEIYDVRDGTHDSPKYIDSGYPLITSKNLKNGFVNFEKVKYISREDYIDINKRSKVDIGDVLFAMIGTIGNPTVITEEPQYAIKNVALFKVDALQSSQYLKYYLESQDVINQMLGDAKGSTQSFVGLGYLRKFPIPIPPLPEQKQIVAILDKAFAAIDQAKANIERNIENAKELFQSKLNDIFSQTGEGDALSLSKGWEEKGLSDICEITSKLIDPNLIEYKDLLHVGGGNIVAETGELIELKTASEEGLISGKFAFETNVVLYNKIRPYLVKVARPTFNGLCSADMYPLTPKVNCITKDFLYFLLISKRFTDYAIMGSGRAGMPKVNRKHLFEYSFSLPSFEKQDEIIIALEAIRAQSQILDIVYRKKIETLEELKKSILQKAFAGELTSDVSIVNEKKVLA